MGMTPETAAWVSDWANAVLVASLIIGVLATYAVVVSGNVKEAALKREVAATNAEAAKATEAAAKAHERAAGLEKEAESLKAQAEADRLARVALERQVAPRQLGHSEFVQLIQEGPSANVEILYVRDDPEVFNLAQQIWRALMVAKWPLQPPVPITNTEPGFQNVPIAMAVGGQPSGVTVIAHAVSQEEAASFGTSEGARKTPFTVLQFAFSKTLGRVGGGGGHPNGPPPGTFRVVVAPRL